MKRGLKKKTILLGLTGGPGVGKTEVAKLLAKHGIKVIFADLIAHELLEYDKIIRRKVRCLLGESIMRSDRKFDRKKIGEIVFDDYEKLWAFNMIIHPPLLKRLKKEIELSEKKRGIKIIVVDAALIYEWGVANWFDMMLAVNTSKQVRIQRLARLGLSKKQIAKRLSSQMPQKDKIALADYIIQNSSTISALKKEVDKFISLIKNTLK